MSNTNYPVAGYGAFGIEAVLKRDWTFQVTGAIPLLACIKDRELNWRKGATINGTKLLIPIVWDDLSAAQQSGSGGFLTSNAGVTDANEVPSAWPTYDVTAGFSQAEYDITHLRRPMTIRSSEKVLVNNARGNLLDGKTKQLMAKFKSVMADMVEGSANASRTSLLGIHFAISNSNTVGNIAQGSNTYWQGNLSTAVGTISLPVINNMYDTILRSADDTGETEAPDLLLLSFNGSSVNTYGRMRELISPAERFENVEFKAKYGISSFMYMGMKCVMSQRSPAGTAAMLSTPTWFYAGYETPQQQDTIRIPGSDAMEYMYTLWAAIGCSEIRRNGRFTGITG